MEKYDKKKVIGSGAFGQAWLVQMKTNDKKYVMKEIKISKVNFICFFIDVFYDQSF